MNLRTIPCASETKLARMYGPKRQIAQDAALQAWAVERIDPNARVWHNVDSKRNGRGPNGTPSIDSLPYIGA